MGETKDLEDTIEKLEDELVEMEVKKNDLEGRVDELETELSSVENDAADSEVECDDLQKNLEVSNSTIGVLEGTVRRITAQRDEANERNEKLWKKNAELQSQIDRAVEVLAKKGEEKLRKSSR